MAERKDRELAGCEHGVLSVTGKSISKESSVDRLQETRVVLQSLWNSEETIKRYMSCNFYIIYSWCKKYHILSCKEIPFKKETIL